MYVWLMPPDHKLKAGHRRRILAQLTRDRLAELTSEFDLHVEDRRELDSHINAIVRKRSLDFTELLRRLKRDELKAACEALGINERGREKTEIIARIMAELAPVSGEDASHLDFAVSESVNSLRSRPASMCWCYCQCGRYRYRSMDQGAARRHRRRRRRGERRPSGSSSRPEPCTPQLHSVRWSSVAASRGDYAGAPACGSPRRRAPLLAARRARLKEPNRGIVARARERRGRLMA
jgi:hypothetical protein